MSEFDFWRFYYVAFSRAQNLLVLTGPKPARGEHEIGKVFDPYAADLPRWNDRTFTYRNLHLAAEYDVSIPTETFILHGVIDLLRGDGDTVEIVDFKTDKKPDVNNPEDRSRRSKGISSRTRR